jgi:hypothetical protein
MSIEATTTLVAPVLDDALVGELDALGIHFLTGGDGRTRAHLPPAVLLAGLAASDDARVQSAIIPLLLVRPDYAHAAAAAAQQLQGRARVLFCCLHTAAVYLQQEHAHALRAAGFPTAALAERFVAELDLPTRIAGDQGLHLLALRQKQLLQDSSDWLATYEHACARLLRRRAAEMRWSQ